MKTFYTLSFFTVMAVLAKISYLFLSNMDTGHHFWMLFVLLLSMAACIALLIYCLSAYIDLPSGPEHR